MTNDKQLLTNLRTEFDDWEQLLSGMPEEQIVSQAQPSGLTVKDQLAHLWAWQQLSIARLEAALHDREPQLPDWPKDLDSESEDEETHKLNAWFYETNKDKSWADVYGAWKAGFLRFLELAEAIPESDLHDAGKFTWLDGYPLSVVLTGSYEHHHIDHLEPLQAWLRDQRLSD